MPRIYRGCGIGEGLMEHSEEAHLAPHPHKREFTLAINSIPHRMVQCKLLIT